MFPLFGAGVTTMVFFAHSWSDEKLQFTGGTLMNINKLLNTDVICVRP